jgi:hypothetical protein
MQNKLAIYNCKPQWNKQPARIENQSGVKE